MMIEIKRDDMKTVITRLNYVAEYLKETGNTDALHAVLGVMDYINSVAPMIWKHKGCGGEIRSVSIDECRLDKNENRQIYESRFFLKCSKCEKTWSNEGPEWLNDIAEWGY